VSIPVHEAPAVVLDQVANVRAFLPDALIVLHVSQSFVAPELLAPLLPDGVYVNEASLPTEWGDTSQVHNANFRFMDAREHFDVFVMHASNDAYVRAGAQDRLAQADAGTQLNATHPAQCGRQSVRDLGLAAAHDGMRRLAQGGPVYASQPEGMFFERALFRRMLAEIEDKLGTGARTYKGDETFWGAEHYVYSTTAAQLADHIVPPVLYSEVQGTTSKRAMSEAVIWAIREGRFAEHGWVDPNDPAGPYAIEGVDLGPPFRVYDFDHVYAVKRIPREYDHPLRMLIRGIARAEAGPLHRPGPATSRGLTIAALADEVIADPALLAAAARCLTASDPVTFAIGVAADRVETLLPALAATIATAGLDGSASVDLEAVSIAPGELGLCALAGGADAVLSGQTVPAPLDSLIRVDATNAHQIRPLLERRAAGRVA
jgi:hypothetical protein